MRYDIIAEVIRREAAYWMALVVCPSRQAWEETYKYYYNQANRQEAFIVPFVVNFEKELIREAL